MKFPVYGLENENREAFSMEVLMEEDAPQFYEELAAATGALDYINGQLAQAENTGQTRSAHFWEKESRIKELEVKVLQLQLRVLDLLKQHEDTETQTKGRPAVFEGSDWLHDWAKGQQVEIVPDATIDCQQTTISDEL